MGFQWLRVDDIDRSAPNPEICAQYGASAIAVDLRAFVTLSPFAVHVSQPRMQPGCVIRSSNWSILQSRNLVTSEDVNQCRNRMNTFGFTGDIEKRDAASHQIEALLNPAMMCPHPQPFSPGRRELEFIFPLLRERARVRADFAIHSIIQQRPN